MVLSWDFEYTNSQGNSMTTRTSQDLLEEVTYPIAMHEIIENRVRKNEPLINNLFVPKNTERQFNKQKVSESIKTEKTTIANKSSDSTLPKAALKADEKIMSTIKGLKDGFGFIVNQPKDAFFFHSSLVNYDFNDLAIGDKVEFKLEVAEDGRYVAKEISVIE